MPIFTLGYVYQLGDFSTTGGNITPPDEQGARAAGSPPFQMTLEPGYSNIVILVDDDDPNFQETNGADSNQTLAQDVVIDGVLYEAGQRIILNYELTDNDTGLQGYSITILPLGGSNSGSNTTTAFITDSQMVAGQTYIFDTEGNIGGGAGRPYADFLCFTAGGLIDTPQGPRRVDRLRPGDRVLTRDHGAQPVRWIGQRLRPAVGRMAPVEIAPGYLGAVRPHRVSPQHRVLLGGAQVELMCAEDEMLAAACHLAGQPGVRRVETGFVHYVHLALDHHALVRVDGVWSETLLLGPRSRASLSAAQQSEIAALFPDAPTRPAMRAARPILSRHEARALWDAMGYRQVSSPAMNTAAAAPSS